MSDAGKSNPVHKPREVGETQSGQSQLAEGVDRATTDVESGAELMLDEAVDALVSDAQGDIAAIAMDEIGTQAGREIGADVELVEAVTEVGDASVADVAASLDAQLDVLARQAAELAELTNQESASRAAGEAVAVQDAVAGIATEAVGIVPLATEADELTEVVAIEATEEVDASREVSAVEEAGIAEQMHVDTRVKVLPKATASSIDASVVDANVVDASVVDASVVDAGADHAITAEVAVATSDSVAGNVLAEVALELQAEAAASPAINVSDTETADQAFARTQMASEQTNSTQAVGDAVIDATGDATGDAIGEVAATAADIQAALSEPQADGSSVIAQAPQADLAVTNLSEGSARIQAEVGESVEASELIAAASVDANQSAQQETIESLDAELARLSDDLLNKPGELDALNAQSGKQQSNESAAHAIHSDAANSGATNPVATNPMATKAAIFAVAATSAHAAMAGVDSGKAATGARAEAKPVRAAESAATTIIVPRERGPSYGAALASGLGKVVGVIMPVFALANAPLAKKPRIVRDSAGWVAANTVFCAVCLWAWMLFFRGPNQIAEAHGSFDISHAELPEVPKKPEPKSTGHGADEHGAKKDDGQGAKKDDGQGAKKATAKKPPAKKTVTKKKDDKKKDASGGGH